MCSPVKMGLWPLWVFCGGQHLSQALNPGTESWPLWVPIATATWRKLLIVETVALRRADLRLCFPVRTSLVEGWVELCGM